MSDVTDTKPTEEVKPTEEKTVTEQATDAASSAATAVKDNVFSMFGGGPKKEKKEETDEGANEPSGSSKAVKKEGEVNTVPAANAELLNRSTDWW